MLPELNEIVNFLTESVYKRVCANNAKKLLLLKLGTVLMVEIKYKWQKAGKVQVKEDLERNQIVEVNLCGMWYGFV